MDTMIKPIQRYTEEEIANTWPDFIQDFLNQFANKICQIDRNETLIGELSYLVESIYREGYKDGLYLCSWLENGSRTV